jgi:hypothetical protein
VKDVEKPTKPDRDPAVKQAGRAIRKMQRLAQKIYETTPGITESKHSN